MWPGFLVGNFIHRLLSISQIHATYLNRLSWRVYENMCLLRSKVLVRSRRETRNRFSFAYFLLSNRFILSRRVSLSLRISPTKKPLVDTRNRGGRIGGEHFFIATGGRKKNGWTVTTPTTSGPLHCATVVENRFSLPMIGLNFFSKTSDEIRREKNADWKLSCELHSSFMLILQTV